MPGLKTVLSTYSVPVRDVVGVGKRGPGQGDVLPEGGREGCLEEEAFELGLK